MNFAVIGILLSGSITQLDSDTLRNNSLDQWVHEHKDIAFYCPATDINNDIGVQGFLKAKTAKQRRYWVRFMYFSGKCKFAFLDALAKEAKHFSLPKGH